MPEPAQQSEKLFSDDDLERLVLSAANHDGTIDEDEAVRVVRWAERARVDAILLQLMLRGRVLVSFKQGATEPTFHSHRQGAKP